jgi:uncharacterized protein (DUF1697 family)
VIFTSQFADKQIIEQMIEKALFMQFSMKINVIVVSFEELNNVVEHKPKSFGEDKTKFKYDVWFLKSPLTSQEVTSNIRLKESVDFVFAGDGVVYSSRLIERASQSYMSELSRTQYYKNLTIRNWNTTKRLLEIMQIK